jgi:hypothetical protein
MEIKGYPQYTIDLQGRVYSKKSRKFLKPHKNKVNKYWHLSLCKNGIPQSFPVHRLMAETYLPNPRNKPKVIHKNGDRNDNKLFNLKWCLSEEFIYKKKANTPTGFEDITYCKEKKEYHLEIIKYNRIYHKQIFPINKWVLDEVVKIRNDYYLELNIIAKENSTGYDHISLCYDKEGSYYKFQIRYNNNDLEYKLFRTSEVLLDEVVKYRNKSYTFWNMD